ncbi:MAG: class I SAM-dependent methyltransferase [Firmicutes bacterium]|nr:class I SAM-dependent methyltransferase [Bacillota bacterium]
MKPHPDNARLPQGDGGRATLNRMNEAHASMAAWGFSHIAPAKDAHALDLGCGGGANLAVLLESCPEGHATGLDYSEISIEISSRTNETAIAEGRCKVVQGDVGAQPFADNSFDLATAFETVYFWPDIQKAFRETLRVLKPGGQFLICNEADGTGPEQEEWGKEILNLIIYTAEQLEEMLKEAGFADIKVYRKPENRWVCAVGRVVKD